jgi:hypothetical protein
MNKRFAFFGRQKEIDHLRTLYTLRKNVVTVGPAGIGKTSVLRRFRQHCPLLLCDDTSSLSRICDCLEGQLGWAHYKRNVIERKNSLLAYLLRRGEPVAFDHMARTAPRIARLIAYLGERVPVWIACRSDRPDEAGHIWPELYKFVRIQIAPLTLLETRAIVEQAVAQKNIQADVGKHAGDLHQMSGVNPRILEELLIAIAVRRYKMDDAFGLDLLDLDRRIHEIDLSIRATAETKK